MSAELARTKAACLAADKSRAVTPQALKPAYGMRCFECQVGWQPEHDGFSCWNCGKVGTP